MQQKTVNDVFSDLLGVKDPIKVMEVNLDMQDNEVHIELDIAKGSKFSCPLCDKTDLTIHDRIRKTWRHMNIFQFATFLHFSVPRVICPNCGVHLIDVPWARNGSGFTLLFEYFVLSLAKTMPVLDISMMLGEYDTRIWRIISHYVNYFHAKSDWSNVSKVGIDETSSKKGHNYISVFVDMV